jgi:TPR repeat protein
MNEKDRKKAMKYFQSLVVDFDDGKLIGEEREYGAIAKLWLGIMLCEGYYTKSDPEEGVKLIKAADVLFNGFERFGFKIIYKIGEIFAQGLTQVGREPSIADLDQAIKYLDVAIKRFNPEKDDPNNRGFLQLAEQYLRNTKNHKDSKEKEKRHTGIDNTWLTKKEKEDRQNKIMEISDVELQWMNACKSALGQLQKRLEREG